MKKKFVLSVALALICITGFAMSRGTENKSFDEAGSWYGLITDDQCGKGHEAKSEPDAKACALKCMGKGAKLVLYAAKNEKIYALSDQNLAKTHAGEHVRVYGTLSADGRTITVSEIK